MKLMLKLCVLVAAAWGSSVSAQWAWTDQEGRKLFSDRAPTSDVPDIRIFKRPASAQKNSQSDRAESNVVATQPTTPSSAAGPAVASGQDKALLERKLKADKALAEQRDAAEKKVAAEKAENCLRAKDALRTYNSGMRLSTLNSNGEREIMSDTKRATETKRINDVIQKDCK